MTQETDNRGPGRVSPGLVTFVRHLLDPLVRLLHRPTLDGLDNLPAKGPYLLVANHSAGMGLSEIGAFYALYLRHFGRERPLAGFALPVGFRVPPMAALLRAGGAIPSTYEAAEATLIADTPILMFPGGDYETTRPLWQAHRVDFGGRLGFLRIARKTGVPIVPMGIRGSHFTAPILLRSRALATLLVAPRIIGQKRWALSVLGLMGAIALATLPPLSLPLRALLIWVWLGSPLTFLPWIPWRIRMRIGTPLQPQELFSGAADEAQLQQALKRVEAAVEDLVHIPARETSPGSGSPR